MLLIPGSLGELLDKISILQIKQTQIKDPSKLAFVKKELKYLLDKLRELDHYQLLTTDEYRRLCFHNMTLWKLEDDIRDKEHQKVFDDEFITISRNIYLNNDKRCEMKLHFNKKYNSDIVEVKSYEPY